MQIYEPDIYQDTEGTKNGSILKLTTNSDSVVPGPAPCLDTLALGGTRLDPPLLKRARRKFIGNALAIKLASVPGSKLTKSYWNSYHCSSSLLQEGKTITSKYCNARWCPVCNAIRTAKLIRGYAEVIDAMVDRQFLTLTIPNVAAEDLSGAITQMIDTFRRIKDTRKKQKQRGTVDTQIVGLRKLEVTYNSVTNTYHPHFHLVVEGKEVGMWIMNEWLERYPQADRRGQDLRPADDDSVMELFKYVTKLTSKAKGNKGLVYVNALDVIFTAMVGRQVFKAIGITKQVSEDVEEIDSQIYEDVDAQEQTYWSWSRDHNDWVDVDSGELLTCFVPSSEVLEFVCRKIITRSD